MLKKKLAPVFGRLFIICSVWEHPLSSKQTNKQAKKPSTNGNSTVPLSVSGKEMFSTHSRSAGPLCSPVCVIQFCRSGLRLGITSSRSLSLTALRPPEVTWCVPWLSASPPLDSELYEGMDCAVLLCPWWRTMPGTSSGVVGTQERCITWINTLFHLILIQRKKALKINITTFPFYRWKN